MSDSEDKREQPGAGHPDGQAEPAQGRRTGEGAASALQHLITQNEQQRRQNVEADDAQGRGQ